MKHLQLRLRPIGDAAILAEYDESDIPLANRHVLGLMSALKAARPAGIVDVSPAYHTLLVFFDPLVLPPTAAAEVIAAADRAADIEHAAEGPTVEMEVSYGGADGPDLPDVARHSGLSEAEVVARHSAGLYVVMFVGFMPGFAYLAGLDPRLATPRLPTPRREVPTGSVGIGGDQTGVYPAPLPGGWRLIGRTALTLYDPHRDPPTLLCAGDRVRFVAI
ncbi:MAG: 5-oxoprolinase subunit PxpB [Anaerolineae bacterium]